ncbi:MAG TPA: dihydrolipoamide acetyltransferase family protein [Gammaproteobacteria bacterium]|nr:dihydrolipoamide acetyltransferase family protein [Gammaproteobacteria bacterium]
MTLFNLPDLGEGLAEAEIHEWYVKEGDTVAIDQPMVSMETAKAVVDVPAPCAGKIVKLYGKKGDIIATHAPLVEFESDEDEAPLQKDKGTVVGSLEESATLLNEDTLIIGSAKKTGLSAKAMPAVRQLAKQLNVNLDTVTPTGPSGQITVDDVKKAASPASKWTGHVETLHGVRRSMATIMTKSHQEIVPVVIIEDADVTRIQSDFTAHLLQAILLAAKAEPSLNAWYDGKSMERCLHTEVNVGLAMDTEEGLFVPVLKNVEMKSATALRSEIDQFKKSVRERTISPSDLQGATITLSNFGTIAGRYATPIIVPPMVAILGCGKCRDEVRAREGAMEIRRIAPLSLSFDHRAVTGGEATRFLAAVIDHLEKGN